MKLPELKPSPEPGVFIKVSSPGHLNIAYNDRVIVDRERYRLHNEQIAAQLTMCVFRPHNCEDTIANIGRTYKIFLDRPNKGEL